MKHRVAVVGAGYFAQHQLQGWRDIGCPAVALCDLHAQRLATQADAFAIEARFTDLAQMLDAVQPDLLDVVLPPAAQAAVVQAALARGIAVICQKPFGADLAQALAMAAIAAEHRTPLVVHENFRFTPWFREARRCIDSGLLGDLHGIAFRLRPGDGQGPRAYLDRQPYFQAMPRLLVRETAVHFIDTFRFLMGEVRSVQALLRRLNPAIAGEDAALIVFEFTSGASGLFDGNRLNDHGAADPRRTMGEMWLEGSAGVLRLDGDARLWFKPHHGPERPHPCEARFDRAFGGACAALQAHVLAHLDHGTPLHNAARDYLANLEVQEAIYRSHECGRRIDMATFDPLQSPKEGDDA